MLFYYYTSDNGKKHKRECPDQGLKEYFILTSQEQMQFLHYFYIILSILLSLWKAKEQLSLMDKRLKRTSNLEVVLLKPKSLPLLKKGKISS